MQLSDIPKPIRIVAGVILIVLGLPLTIYGIYMLLGDNFRSAKFVAVVGVLVTIMGVGLIGNALGFIKD